MWNIQLHNDLSHASSLYHSSQIVNNHTLQCKSAQHMRLKFVKHGYTSCGYHKSLCTWFGQCQPWIKQYYSCDYYQFQIAIIQPWINGVNATFVTIQYTLMNISKLWFSLCEHVIFSHKYVITVWNNYSDLIK